MNTLKTILETDAKYADLKTKVDNILADELITSPILAIALRRLNAKLDSNKNIKTNKRSDGPIPSRLLNELTRNVNVLYNRLNKIKNSNNKITKPRGRPSRSSKTITPVAPASPSDLYPFDNTPDIDVSYNVDNTFSPSDMTVISSNKNQTIIKVDMKKAKTLTNLQIIQAAINVAMNTNKYIKRGDVTVSFKMLPYNVNDISELVPAGLVNRKTIPGKNKKITISNKYNFDITVPQNVLTDIDTYLETRQNTKEMWKVKTNLSYVNNFSNIPTEILESIAQSRIYSYSPDLYIIINNVKKIGQGITHNYFRESPIKGFHCVYSPIKKYFESRINENTDWHNLTLIKSSLNKLNTFDFNIGYPINDPIKCQEIADTLHVKIVIIDLFLNHVSMITPNDISNTIKCFVFQVDGLNHVEHLDMKTLDVNIRSLIESKKMKIIKKTMDELTDLSERHPYKTIKYVNNNGDIKKLIINNTMYVLDSALKNPFNKVLREIHPDFAKYAIESKDNPIYDYVVKALCIGTYQNFALGFDGVQNLSKVKEIDHCNDYINFGDNSMYDKYQFPTTLSNIIKYIPPISSNNHKEINNLMTGFYTINNIQAPKILHGTIRNMDLVKNNCCYTIVDIQMFIKLGYTFDIIMGVYSRNTIRIDFNDRQLDIIKARPSDTIDIIDAPINININNDEIDYNMLCMDYMEEFNNITPSDEEAKIKPRWYCTGLGCWNYTAKNETIHIKVNPASQTFEYARVLKNSNPYLEINAIGDEYIRISKPQASHFNHVHMYAYITAYSRTNLINQILKFNERDIIAVHLDSVIINPSIPNNIIEPLLNKNYRIKSDKHIFVRQLNRVDKSAFPFDAFTKHTLDNLLSNVAIDSNNDLIKHSLTLVSGAGGCAKTYSTIKTLSNSSSTIITFPSNSLRAAKRDEIQQMKNNNIIPKNANVKTGTWMSLGVGFTPNGSKPLNTHNQYPDTLVIDEITMMSKALLNEIINMYKSKVNQIILLGDLEIDDERDRIHYYQIKNDVLNYEDDVQKINGVLHNIHQIKLSKSYRFKEHDPINQVCQILRDDIKNNKSYNINSIMTNLLSSNLINIENNIIKQSTIKAEYKKDDIVLTSRITCKYCKDTGIKCPKKHECTAMVQRYTNILWCEKNDIKKWYVTKQVNRESGIYYKSTIIDHDIGPAACCKRLSYTIHSFQGTTVKDNNVFIDCVGSNYQTLYTSISRATSISQIKFIQPNV